MDNHALRPEVIEARKGNVGKSIRFSTTLQQRMMYVAIPLKDKEEIIAVIRAALPVTAIDQALKVIQIKIMLGGLFIALLAAGISLYVSRRISRPIEKLKQGADFFARGDLSHRMPGTDLVEIDSLIEALNQMAGQLEDRLNMIVRQKNELAAVLSSMAEGVIAVDMDEQIISINKAAARIFENLPENLLNRSIPEVIRNPDLQKFINKALSSKENLEEDITLYQRGERILYVHNTPLEDPDGQRSGILVVLNDVTHLRKLENMRKDFAANVSHEIKTPLTAIKGFVETLRTGGKAEPKETERFLAIIEKHVNRLTAIIEDLMKLSKIEQQDEKSDIHLEESSVKSVISSAIQTCREKAKAKKITIDLVCPEDISFQCDSRLMTQAMVNLLDNAINYSNEKSDIQISASLKDDELMIQCSGSWHRNSKRDICPVFLKDSTGSIRPEAGNSAVRDSALPLSSTLLMPMAAVSPLTASLGKEARFHCICRRSNSYAMSLNSWSTSHFEQISDVIFIFPAGNFYPTAFPLNKHLILF